MRAMEGIDLVVKRQSNSNGLYEKDGSGSERGEGRSKAEYTIVGEYA